jgi:hypothetical protein
MATHAKIAARLLRSAAAFFREIGGQGTPVSEQMEKNARTYEAIADLVERDPAGEMPLPSEADSPKDLQ